MITLDTTSLNDSKDEIYSVERGSKVKAFLNGDELNSCIYVNITKGVAICLKRDLEGWIVVVNDTPVHELIFGNITVEQVGAVGRSGNKRQY